MHNFISNLKKTTSLVCLFTALFSCGKKEENKLLISKNEVVLDSVSKEKCNSKNINYGSYYQEAKQYCSKNNLNQDIFILINLGIHSGLKRFFIYDFKTKIISDSFMVSHGCGDSAWGEAFTKENAAISNKPDSHCSSIGKYIVLNRGISQWGIKVNYVLKGNDKTNSNAINRAIVLHSWEAVPENEVCPEGTPEGWGCPAVSNKSMKTIDSILQKNKKVLLWIIKI